MNNKTVKTIILAIIVQGCASNSRYSLKQDRAPKIKIHQAMEDAKPRYEPLSISGNKEYSFENKTYKIKKDLKSYEETGIASWYGEKFHKHKTANGEVYDMYKMSAAHTTLPIPSYVKVTNLENNKTTIVRVNDRGPFRKNRIIDLSYAAAHKLDMLGKGTAKVKIELIKINKESNYSKKLYVQVFASRNDQNTNRALKDLKNKTQLQHVLIKEQELNKIQIGPFDNEKQARNFASTARKIGYSGSFLVYK